MWRGSKEAVPGLAVAKVIVRVRCTVIRCGAFCQKNRGTSVGIWGAKKVRHCSARSGILDARSSFWGYAGDVVSDDVL